MLFYGDQRLAADPREERARLRRALDALPPAPPPPELAVELLVRCGLLAQGLADAAFERAGVDDPDAAADGALEVALALAGALWGPEPRRTLDRARGAAAALEHLELPARVALRVPEGYAHYAVHPEGYARAAQAAGARFAGPWCVIGIRSIGTSLAAAVAAALGAPPPVTVRPTGHPYARALALGPVLSRMLRERAAQGARFAVVDEGPGRSGSSFASVVAALTERGAPPERVHLFPSHGGGPGPEASAEIRARWNAARRHVAELDADALLAPDGPVAAALGASRAKDAGGARDLASGRWRQLTGLAPERWPPSFAQQERRKWLFTDGECGREGAVVELVGLGPTGAARAARARALADAGFGPPVRAVAHGYLVRPWLAGRSLAEGPRPAPASLVPRLARYLAFRARAFPASPAAGATPARLLELIRVNAGEALGEAWGATAGVALAEGVRAAHRGEPVAVDGKLEAWEWLVGEDGRLEKVDALQHADAHDLAGAQDVSWDLAGAVHELELDADAAADLTARLGRALGRSFPPALLRFQTAGWCALRVGRWSLALGLEGDAAERARIASELARQREGLRRALSP